MSHCVCKGDFEEGLQVDKICALIAEAQAVQNGSLQDDSFAGLVIVVHLWARPPVLEGLPASTGDRRISDKRLPIELAALRRNSWVNGTPPTEVRHPGRELLQWTVLSRLPHKDDETSLKCISIAEVSHIHVKAPRGWRRACQEICFKSGGARGRLAMTAR